MKNREWRMENGEWRENIFRLVQVFGTMAGVAESSPDGKE
jgi:hypothetical protein